MCQINLVHLFCFMGNVVFRWTSLLLERFLECAATAVLTIVKVLPLQLYA